MERTDEDINNDTYKTVKFHKDRATKECEINIEKKKILKERRKKAYMAKSQIQVI